VVGELVGNYRVTAVVGEGGMGVVYRAEHILIGQTVAVKVLQPEFSGKPEIVKRFFNEARAAALVKHPGIVGVYDFGYHASGRAYLVMEYLQGETLAERIRRAGGLPDSLIVMYARQIASAIAAAHDKGIIHRDLKPENVFLVPDEEAAAGERLKVLDFGIAKLNVEIAGGATRTRTGSVVGSPTYMAPEQCKGGGQVDARADVYAIGCLMFEMAAGRPPFLGDGVGDVIAKHIYEPPPPPRSLVPQLSAELEAVILRCLEKAPGDRFASASELARTLERVGGLSPSPRFPSAGGVIATPVPGTSTTTLESAASEKRGHVARKRRALIATGVTVPILVGAIAALGLVANRAQTPALPAVATDAAVLRPVVAPPSSPDSTTPRPPPAPVPAATARLSITTSPAGAAVYRGGARLGTTPFERDFEKSAGKTELVVKKSGFRDEHVAVMLDQDRSVALKLTPEARRPRPERDPLDPYSD